MKRVDKMQSLYEDIGSLIFIYRLNNDQKLLNEIIAKLDNLETYVKWERIERKSF